MAKVIQFEINTKDPERIVKFYRELFGWKIEERQDAVASWSIAAGSDDEPGINGGIVHMPAANPGTWHVVRVPSVDEYLEKVVSLGGQVFASKRAITGKGWDAYIQDPEGSVFGIFEEDEGAR
jgi:predicted enzyme related to lactoylglutathione lyase